MLFNCPIGDATVVQGEVRGCDSGISVYPGGRSSAELQRYLLSVPPAPKSTVTAASSSSVDQSAIHWIATREAMLDLVDNTALLVLLVTDAVDSTAVADFATIALTDTAAVSSASSEAVTQAAVRYCASTSTSLLDSDQERAARPTIVMFREFGQSRVALPSQISYASAEGSDVSAAVANGYAWNATTAASFVRANRFNLVSKYIGGAFASYYYDRHASGHVLLLANTSDEYFPALKSEFELLAGVFSGLSANNTPSLLSTTASSSALIVRFLVVPTEIEQELCNALAVVDDAHIPTLLLVRNVSQPAVRFALDGAALLDTISKAMSSNDTRTNSSFVGRASTFLEDALLPVFAPSVQVTADATMSYDEFWEEGFQRWEESGDGTDSSDVSIVSRQLAVDERIDADDDDEEDDEDEDLHYYYQPPTHQQARTHVVQTITHADQLRRYDGDAPLVVVFSTPRCSACRSFAPVFDAAAAYLLRRHGSMVEDGVQPIFARVNVDQVDGLQTLNGLESLRLLPGVFVFPPKDDARRHTAPLAIASAPSWTAKRFAGEVRAVIQALQRSRDGGPTCQATASCVV